MRPPRPLRKTKTKQNTVSNYKKKLDRAGTYIAKVVPKWDSWFGESGEKKTPYINLTLEVDEGPESESEISFFGYLSDKAVDHTLKNIALAFPGWKGIHDIDSLINRQCEIVVEEDTYNGKSKMVVRYVNVIGGGSRSSGMDADKTKSLIARLQGKSKAIVKMVEEKSGRMAHEDIGELPTQKPWEHYAPKRIGGDLIDENSEIPF